MALAADSLPGAMDTRQSSRRENEPMQLTQPIAPGRQGRASRARAERFGTPTRWLGAIGLLLVVGSLLALAVEAAGSPSQYVPADSGGWPGWLAGPLAGAGSHLGTQGFQALMLAACAGYLFALACARRLPPALLGGAIVLAHAAMALGPPLISQDVFGYLDFARMGALHGLDPYTRIPAEAAGDPAFPFIGWPFGHSPYGPLFTLPSYALAPLGLAGGLWTLKALCALASLAAVWLTAGAAARMGRSPATAAAFVGLNPVLLALAVGGAHNDTLLLAALAGALWLTAGTGPAGGRAGRGSGERDDGGEREGGGESGAGGERGARSRPRAAALALATAAGVKLTGGLALPFLALSPRAWRERLRIAGAGLLGLALVLVVGVIGFGPHALGFLSDISDEQQQVATHSLPAESARLLGLQGTPEWWRHLWAAAFLLVLLCALYRTARGADWRVAAGWATLALLAATAWLLPWYAVWPLPLAAVSGDRRLRGAVLVLCAYAVLIHLALAEPLLSPGRPANVVFPARTGLGHSLEFAGLKILRHVHLDLRW